jgi:serine/threonine-protein kinase
MDFGIAKSEDMSLTKTGFQVGTPFYMSPEQVNGEKATERSDVYSFGLVIFEMFTGVKAIEGTTIAQVFSAILHQQVDFSRMRETDAPPELVALVERMSAKDPALRPASFVEVINELKRIAAPAQVPLAASTLCPSPARASRAKLMAGLIGLIVVLTPSPSTWSPTTDGLEGRKADGTKLEQASPPETGDMKLVPGGPFRWGNEGFQSVLPPTTSIRRRLPTRVTASSVSPGRQLPDGLDTADSRLPVVNVAAIDAKDCAWAGKRLRFRSNGKGRPGTDLRPYPGEPPPIPPRPMSQTTPNSAASLCSGRLHARIVVALRCPSHDRQRPRMG